MILYRQGRKSKKLTRLLIKLGNKIWETYHDSGITDWVLINKYLKHTNRVRFADGYWSEGVFYSGYEDIKNRANKITRTDEKLESLLVGELHHWSDRLSFDRRGFLFFLRRKIRGGL